MIVPEPRFYLKCPSYKEPTLICLQAKYEGNRVFISTGNKILPDDWDFKSQRAKITKKNLSHGQINFWLDKMAVEFKTVFRNYMIDGVFPEASLVIKKMQENLNLTPKEKEVKKLTLFDFIQKYISECRNSKSINTIKSYQGTLLHLIKYSQICSKPFDFDDITIEWRVGFINYLQQLGFGRNTEGKHIKNIKVFMNEATDRKLTNNLSFKSRSFQKPTEDVHKIFLTIEEISVLHKLQMSPSTLQDIVRDYFLISCMTSLRYSDVIDIKPENIKENTIQMITKKTGEEVIIPISPVVNEILIKHNFQLPKAPCNQVFNRVLKEVGKLAGINENISVTKTIGGIKKTTIYKKYQLLTCHTGRRSMISNSILAGLPTSSVMLISAHKSLKVFQSYVRINQKQNAEALAKHTFFNS
jgi:integrase